MPEEIDFDKLLNFTGKQQQARQAVNDYDYVLYGGAMGGGKSHWLRWMMVDLLTDWAAQGKKGVRAGLFCEDYPSLKDRHFSKIQYEFPEWLGTLNRSDHEYILKKQYGAGVICFRNLDDPSKYQSSEFAAIAVDELTKDDYNTFLFLRTRKRWPGIERTKFLAGTNPGGIGHCIPYGEVLTFNGWKNIKDINVGEIVASADEEESLIYLPVAQKIEEIYSGELYDFHTATAKIVCTPNHKIERRTETKNRKGRVFHKPKLIKIRDVSECTNFVRSVKGWDGQEITEFVVPVFSGRKTKLKQPKIINGKDYCELMGWFLSEGFTVDRDKEFGIAQSKADSRLKIKELLDRAGFFYRENKNGFSVSSPDWWAYLKQFGKCRNKFIPFEIKNSNYNQLNIFWKAMMMGDGCGSHYYTTSKQLADDMQEVGLKLKFTPSIKSRTRKNREGLSYDVNFRIGRDGWMQKNKIKKYNFNGNVYCLGIPNTHKFFVRQNGTIWVSGNSWTKRIWMDKEFEAGEKEQDQFYFIQSKATDNPYLSDSYYASLSGLPEQMRKAYVDGDWNIFKGQVFSEWRDDIHTIIPFTIPQGWRRYRTYDYGRTSPACCLWVAQDYDGRLYVYREYYEAGKNADEQAREIIKMSGDEQYHFSVADSAIFSPTGIVDAYGTETIAETFARNGLSWMPSSKRRIDGWNLLHERLAHTENNPPMVLFFKNCYNTIKTIPSLIYNENNPEDVNTDGEDHAADCVRYLLVHLHDSKSTPPKTETETKLIRKRGETLDFNKMYSI